MREIEKMLTKKFLENFYRQKYLEEEALMEMFGRDIVLQMSKKYTLSSQEPNAANETGFKAPAILQKGVQLTLGGPPLDQDRCEERLSIHKEGSLTSQLHPGGKENTNLKMLLNFTPSQHQKERNENSSEDPTVLRNTHVPLMGGGPSFVSDTQGGPSLNDQDRREQRHGIYEECDLPFQRAKPKMLLDYSMSSQQPKATNKISEKAPTVLHKGVQMTLMGGGPSSVSSSNADRHEERLGIHVEGCLPFQLYPEIKENTKPKMILNWVRGISTPNQLEPKKPDISHSEVGFGTRTSMPLVNSSKKCSPQTKENTDALKRVLHRKSCTSTKKWECQLCHVMTDTKEVLEQHYKGKKHKKKEKVARKSSIISPAIKESVKENTEARLEDDLDKLGSGPSVLEKDEIITNEDAFGTKRKIAPAEEEQGNEIASLSHQNKKVKFWCQGCKFGSYTEATMFNHRMGMEHMELMKMNGGAVIVEINGPGDSHNVDAGNDGNSKKYGKVYSRRQKKVPEHYQLE